MNESIVPQQLTILARFLGQASCLRVALTQAA